MSGGKLFSLLGQALKLETREDIRPHLEKLNVEVVEEIIMGGNTIGVEASLAFAEVLQKAKKLRVANFADIYTGRLISEIPQSLTALCNALKDHTSLIEVDFSDNAFGGRSADPLVPLLTENRHIQVLKLNNNGLGVSGGTIVAEALQKSAELSKKEGKPSQLKTVICGRNRLENGSAPLFAEAFALHGNLEVVRMIQNGIRSEGTIALAEALAKCPNLRELDLQDNVASTDGCTALSKSLASWPHLEHLNLSDCVLTPEGGAELITALAEVPNSKLKTLMLQNAELDDDAIALLRQKLEDGLESIARLEIQWNDNDPDLGSIQEMKDILKIRGGVVLYMSDEEEEEESDEEGEPGEEVEEKAADGTAKDKGVDELADMFSRAKIVD